MLLVQSGAEAACIDRSRGGLTTKLHAVFDAIDLPICINPTLSHDGDCKQPASRHFQQK